MMKKVLLIISSLVIVIAIAIPLFISLLVIPNIKKEFYGGFPQDPSARKDYVFANSEPWVQNKQTMKYFGYKVPFDSELADLKKSTDLTRHYPATIKAVFDPGVMANTIDLVYYPDELANLGVNTYWVIGEYRITNNKISQFMAGFNQAGFPSVLSQDDAIRMLKWRILLAKKEGFATVLIPDYPSANDIGRANFDVAKLKPEFERVAFDLAKIAEEYQTEYFSPINEYEHLMILNGYSVDEIVKNEAEFYQDLTPKIREIYHGKIIYKTGNIGPWSQYPKLSMKGADLFGVGNGYAGSPGSTATDERQKVQAADIVSARDDLPWLETEFLVYRPTDQENFMGKVFSTYPIENSYQEGIGSFEKYEKRAVGFTFMGWTGVGRIRGTKTADLVQQFYERWKPTEKIVVGNTDVSLAMSMGEKGSSILDWFWNLPTYYSVAYGMLTGSMRPQEHEAPVAVGGPGGCKGKDACDLYCSKPEHRDECLKFKPGGKGADSMSGQQKDGDNPNIPPKDEFR